MLRACEPTSACIYMWECMRAGHIGISVHGSCQSCPFVSSENASTVRNDGEIVLLVHCESWIARIRANEVAANRPYSIPSSRSLSLPLSPPLITLPLIPFYIPVVSVASLRLRPSRVFLPRILHSISSHILVHYLRSSASATCCPVFSTSRIQEILPVPETSILQRCLRIIHERSEKGRLGPLWISM